MGLGKVSVAMVISAALGTPLFTASIAPAAVPANDTWGTAEPLTLPFSGEIDTQDATVSPGDPDCHSASHTVWYTLTPRVSHMYVFGGSGPGNGEVTPAIAVFQGPRRSPTMLACDAGYGNDAGDNIEVRARLQAGIRYHVMFGTPDDLGFDLGGRMFVSATKYVRPAISVELTGATIDPQSRLLTVSGPLHCRETFALGMDGYPEVDATIDQGRPPHVAHASGYTYNIGCSSGAPWSITVGSESSHHFRRGRASVTLDAYTCDYFIECAEQQTTVRTRVRST